MIEIINVSSRGQIVIPEKIRKSMGIKKGSRLAMFEKDGSIVLKREEELIKKISEDDKKEELGWLALSENSLQELWNNPKDDKIWKRYLK